MAEKGKKGTDKAKKAENAEIHGVDPSLQAIIQDVIAAYTTKKTDKEEENVKVRKFARGIWREYCEDNHMQEEADILAWMIENDKYPYVSSTPQGSWFNGQSINDGLGEPGSDIPPEVYTALPVEGPNKGVRTANHVTFDTIYYAEIAFIEAFKKAVQAGWNRANNMRRDEKKEEKKT